MYNSKVQLYKKTEKKGKCSAAGISWLNINNTCNFCHRVHEKSHRVGKRVVQVIKQYNLERSLCVYSSILTILRKLIFFQF